MRPTIFFVVTLGLIGTWQVFDQVYRWYGGRSPQNHHYSGLPDLPGASRNSKAGLAGAIAVILFAIIMFFTWVNRKVIRDTGDF